MISRRFKEEDTKKLCDIYYNTIHNVNKGDYTEEELEAWAPSISYNEESYKKDMERWNKINPFIVADNDIPIGFAELEDGGHINCFFVHHDYQGRGVGSMLINACINEAVKLNYQKLVAEVSITAKSFFIKKGFKNIKPILCDISGMKMQYYLMEKDIK